MKKNILLLSLCLMIVCFATYRCYIFNSRLTSIEQQIINDIDKKEKNIFFCQEIAKSKGLTHISSDFKVRTEKFQNKNRTWKYDYLLDRIKALDSEIYWLYDAGLVLDRYLILKDKIDYKLDFGRQFDTYGRCGYSFIRINEDIYSTDEIKLRIQRDDTLKIELIRHLVSLDSEKIDTSAVGSRTIILNKH